MKLLLSSVAAILTLGLTFFYREGSWHIPLLQFVILGFWVILPQTLKRGGFRKKPGPSDEAVDPAGTETAEEAFLFPPIPADLPDIGEEQVKDATDDELGDPTPPAPEAAETDAAEEEITPNPATQARDQAIDQMLKLLPELTAMADGLSQNIGKAAEISQNISGTAKDAFDLAERVQDGVATIGKILESSKRDTEQLQQRSKEISTILSIMTDISGKIHVLSINASIVSVRAGEHGLGFAVVAKEIRKLAEETERSLSEIAGLVEDIQGRIGQVTKDAESAQSETTKESEALLKVADALRGVMLAIEVINTVSTMSVDMAQNQKNRIASAQASLRDEGAGEGGTP